MKRPTPTALRWLRSAISNDSSRLSSPRAHPTYSFCNKRTPLAPSISILNRRTIATTSSLPQSTASASASASSTSTKETTSPLPHISPATTHYALFPQTLPQGPPPAGPFAIDVRALRREFLQLQARFHPDLHASPTAKAAAQNASARINEAYKTLSSPLLRAQYLLSQRGIDAHSDDAAKLGGAEGAMGEGEEELLMEVLEAREEVESAESEEEVGELKRVNEMRVEEAVRGLERAFKEDDLRRALRLAVRLRYWENIGESLHAWEEGVELPPLVH